MRKIESDCVYCPPNLPCLGSSCPYKEVERFYCDNCKEETTLYYYDNQELCKNCLLQRIEVVDGSQEL